MSVRAISQPLRLSDQPDALVPIRTKGRCFETFDGAPFLFIGANDAVSWQGLSGLYKRRNPQVVDAYLEALAAQGATILRVMLEYAQTTGWYFEKPAGRFNPIMVRFWDDLLLRCQRYGLRVLLTPFDTYWMARRWHSHPYNAINGGAAAHQGAFLTDPAIFEAVVRRLRFVIERWGDTGVIAAWDLFNEIDPFWGGSIEQQTAWVARLSLQVREIEQQTWGFTRPQTVSVFGPALASPYHDLIFRHPDLDFATTHIYHGAIDDPHDVVSPALAMRQAVEFGAACAADRPFTDSEHGPIHLFNDHRRFLAEAFDDEYERHLMWAHLMSGGAGSGMRWPARHPHILTPGMRRAFKSLADFCQHVTWGRFNPQPLADRLHYTAQNNLCFGCGDSRQAICWVVCENYTDAPITLMLYGLEPGTYTVVRWNPVNGYAEGSRHETVDSSGCLVLFSERLPHDLAFAVRQAAPA